MHVPAESQDLIGARALRGALIFSAHVDYKIDGIDLNLLASLALRLAIEEPLSSNERASFKTIIDEITSSAKQRGAVE